MSASIDALVAQLAELTAVLRPIADVIAPQLELDAHPATTITVPIDEPSGQPVDERAEQIAGLRQFVDFLEAHPAVPIESTLRRQALWPEHWVDKGDKAAAFAELRRIGDAVGIAPAAKYGRHAYVTVPPFRGGVEVEFIVCDAEDLVRAEETAAGATETADTAPAVGGEAIRGADPSVPGPTTPGAGDTTPQTLLGAEEVAGPDVVPGSATAPDDMVWIAARSKGIPFHAMAPERFTGCGRARRHGATMLRSTAVDILKGYPCKGCYPAEREG